MPILDPYGRPVQRKRLRQGVAEPGVTSIRQAFAGSVASGLTPARLASILLAAAEGDMQDFLVLAEEMEERDLHYASVLGIRKRAISGVVPIVKPASDSPQDKKIAEAVREDLVEHEGFADLIEDMLDALGKGFSQVELIWQSSKSKMWIDRFVHRDPRFFTFDRETGTKVALLDEAAPVTGLPLEPNKWISHRAKLKSGLPIRGGLARLVAFTWMCKGYTIKDWMAFIETYGLPLRLGRYGPEATKDDVETLFLAVANIGTDAAAVLPKNMQIDFEQIASGPGNDIFEKFARWGDEQVSKAVLGQTMSSDNGSSKAQAEVHNEVRHDVAKADARGVMGTLNRDLVRPYVAFNFGVQEHYPKIDLVIEEAEDLDMILKNADRMMGRGLKLKASEVRAKMGFTEPDGDDEVIGGGPPAKSAPTEELTARNRAQPDEETGDPYGDVRAIEDELNGEWEDVLGDAADGLLSQLETAANYEDASALIRDAAPQMGTAKLIDALVKATVRSRAAGDLSDG